MKLICKYCGEPFEWEPPKGCRSHKPKICGEYVNSKWQPTPDCARKRKRITYAKWRTTHPARYKQKQHEQYARRKSGRLYECEYVSKDTPQPKKYRCQNCGKLTINRFNCSACLTNKNLSQEYDDLVYGGGTDEDFNIHIYTKEIYGITT